MKKLVIGIVSLILIVMLSMTIIILVDTNKKTEGTKQEPTEEKEPTKVQEVDESVIGDNPIATIQIDGYEDMTFVLFPDKAPESVNNFIELANSGFYDGLTFHRIVTDFVLQGGDPEGTGIGGPGYSIKGEFKNNGVDNDLTHQKGAIAMARSQDNDSAGSQFYICFDDVKNLDGDYAVFGYMLSGEETLDAINKNISSSSGEPKEELKIKSIKVDTKGKEYSSPNKLK